MSAWIMGKVKPTQSHVVVPLADNETSPGVPGPPINVPSVAAEVVVHCENSTRPRAPTSTVVEKIQDIDRDEPSSGGLPEQPEKKLSHPHNSMSLWKCRDWSHVRQFCIHRLPRMW